MPQINILNCDADMLSRGKYMTIIQAWWQCSWFKGVKCRRCLVSKWSPAVYVIISVPLK